jgi:hypothetical protein
MLYIWSKDEHVYVDYIIHRAFGDVMSSHDLWLDVGCNIILATNAILVVDISSNYFIVAN